jgi:hypothetical protein
MLASQSAGSLMWMEGREVARWTAAHAAARLE